MVSRRNPISRTRAPEKRKRSWLEIESGGALVQSRINTYLILSHIESYYVHRTICISTVDLHIGRFGPQSEERVESE